MLSPYLSFASPSHRCLRPPHTPLTPPFPVISPVICFPFHSCLHPLFVSLTHHSSNTQEPFLTHVLPNLNQSNLYPCCCVFLYRFVIYIRCLNRSPSSNLPFKTSVPPHRSICSSGTRRLRVIALPKCLYSFVTSEERRLLLFMCMCVCR